MSWDYQRHNGCQIKTVQQLIGTLYKKYENIRFKIAVCGSGAEPVAEKLNGAYIQEVIATAIAIQNIYPEIRTAIELGGQDSKILFFEPDTKTGKSIVRDMRMNGTCAGGTGAFIDQMAVLLGMQTDELCNLALTGNRIYPISGRCGVFAKSDILPLLNMGISKADIALSVCYSVVNQTMCSLAQGVEISEPVAFIGGPLTYSPALINAYVNRLGLREKKFIVPDYSQVMAALGSAMFVSQFKKQTGACCRSVLNFHEPVKGKHNHKLAGHLFFANREEYEEFTNRHTTVEFKPYVPEPGKSMDVFIGIDAGSTTLKIVLIDSNGSVVHKWYGNNSGDTIGIARKALLELRNFYKAYRVELNVCGVGTTGYGELLCAKAFGSDFHTVETVSHAAGAVDLVPDVTFVLDIGGQDMKAMLIDGAVIQDVYLNEACSSGCGSFIEATANTLGISTSEIAETAFRSNHAASLGARCTVFMLSSITTEQKNGKSVEELIAGLCRSIVDNLFSKVLRISDAKKLGQKIVVQGGTFKNDAILRAVEQHVGRPVYRSPHCGEMGAYGIALLTRKHMQASSSDNNPTIFIGFDALERMGKPKTSSSICKGCANRCNRTIIEFSNGNKLCTDHRCSRGDISSSIDDAVISPKNIRNTAQSKVVDSMPLFKERLLLAQPHYIPSLLPSNGVTIGIPLVFEFWNSLPFWTVLFKSLGFTTEISGKSTPGIAEVGSSFAASDSICLPAKLMHGHIESLITRNVDHIFVPAMKQIKNPVDSSATNMCPIIQGLPIMVQHLNRPFERKSILLDTPVFSFESDSLRNAQIERYLHSTYGIAQTHIRKAIKIADKELKVFKKKLHQESNRILKMVSEHDSFGVVLLMRPYHADSYINHNIPEIFGSLGIRVLSSDCLPELRGIKDRYLRPEKYNPFHMELYSAAGFTAQHPKLEAVQLISFGCGHDAITSDEVSRIMESTGSKRPLLLKIDDGDSKGALTIRIRSFVETILQRKRRLKKTEQ
jgi:predicted CoA-substrate-specific enzyme activase